MRSVRIYVSPEFKTHLEKSLIEYKEKANKSKISMPDFTRRIIDEKKRGLYKNEKDYEI